MVCAPWRKDSTVRWKVGLMVEKWAPCEAHATAGPATPLHASRQARPHVDRARKEDVRAVWRQRDTGRLGHRVPLDGHPARLQRPRFVLDVQPKQRAGEPREQRIPLREEVLERAGRRTKYRPGWRVARAEAGAASPPVRAQRVVSHLVTEAHLEHARVAVWQSHDRTGAVHGQATP